MRSKPWGTQSAGCPPHVGKAGPAFLFPTDEVNRDNKNGLILIFSLTLKEQRTWGLACHKGTLLAVYNSAPAPQPLCFPPRALLSHRAGVLVSLCPPAGLAFPCTAGGREDLLRGCRGRKVDGKEGCVGGKLLRARLLGAVSSRLMHKPAGKRGEKKSEGLLREEQT